MEFAVPATIAVLVNAVYNIVDQIFIGQGVGYLGNAATTVSFPVMTIVMAFATLIGSGGSAYAAIKLGQRQEGEAEDVLNNMFIIGLLSGILISAAGLIFLDPLLRLFGATDTIMPTPGITPPLFWREFRPAYWDRVFQTWQGRTGSRGCPCTEY